MNEEPASQPQPPPQLPLSAAAPLGPRPIGEDPAEREPIPNVVATVEVILRQPRRLMYQLRQPGAGPIIGAMLLVSVLCSLVYGLVVGSFSQGMQWWAAPVKIAGGLLVAAVICLPSLYIFACLSGSRARLVEVAGLLAGLLMLMTVLLIGFAPVALIFSTSTNSLPWMGTLHLVFWLLGTFFGLRFLQNGFSHSNARSLAGVHVWIVIFLLVVLQMTAALRPLLGTSDEFLPKEKKFFLTHWEECLRGDRADPVRD